MELEVRGIVIYYRWFKRFDSLVLWVKIYYDNDSVDCLLIKVN